MNALVPQMSAAERREPSLIVRRREKYEKTQAEQRSAEFLADFEHQLATIYSWDNHAIWQAAEKEAEAVIEQAQAKNRSRCIELGIPKECRPSLDFGWAGRGQNASKERREELRRVAQARIDAIERTARTQIERRSIEMQEEIMKEKTLMRVMRIGSRPRSLKNWT